MPWTIEEIATIAAADIEDGSVVNLGIGQPERVADFLPEGREIILHSENGILGMGPSPLEADVDPDLMNAGKKPVTLLPGGAYFHHADSFAMIRGGHIDVCIMGAFEVAMNGDLANWSTGEGVPAVGGAMDLAAGARSVRVITTFLTRSGAAKLIPALTLPATGKGVVERVYSDMAVFRPAGDGFQVLRRAPGVSLEDLQGRTAALLYE